MSKQSLRESMEKVSVYLLILGVRLTRFLPKEPKFITRTRLFLRPSWNRIRPSRLLVKIVESHASSFVPDSATPWLSYYNQPEVKRNVNCFGFLAGTKVVASIHDGITQAVRKLCRKPPLEWIDDRSLELNLALKLEEGFKRFHWWNLKKHNKATLVAVYSADHGNDWHVVFLSSDGNWYHKPGEITAGILEGGPFSYRKDYRLRGFYWYKPESGSVRAEHARNGHVINVGLYQ